MAALGTSAGKMNGDFVCRQHINAPDPTEDLSSERVNMLFLRAATISGHGAESIMQVTVLARLQVQEHQTTVAGVHGTEASLLNPNSSTSIDLGEYVSGGATEVLREVLLVREKGHRGQVLDEALVTKGV